MNVAGFTVHILGVAGPSAGGKTTFARAVQSALGGVASVHIRHDDYYRDLAHLPLAERAIQNFDHPDALETDLLVEHLAQLRRGKPVRKPLYDFTRHCRRAEVEVIQPRTVVIVEGILALAIPELRDSFDLRVYVETPADICLARRVLRDVRERGRTIESVVEQYLRFVRPMHEEWVLPSREYADVVVTPEDIEGRAREVAERISVAVNTAQHGSA